MLSECQHSFCKECFEEYFRSLIEEQNKHHLLACPQFGCKTKPEHEEVKAIINTRTFCKYEKFQTNHKVAIDKDLLFCSTPDCGTILNVKDSKKKKLYCSGCKKSTCSNCKQEHHGNNDCSKTEQNMYDGWAKGLGIHKCPNCGCQVQKDGGCPHMDCGVCTYSWCWSCGFKSKSWFHSLSLEIPCGLFNAFHDK
mgnify:CR=1 FL=1